MYSFQERVLLWLKSCFGSEIASDRKERNHRFIEEALELVQSLGCSKEDVLMLVDYVYGRPAGEPSQEVGGVCVTLNGLCSANGIVLEQAAETELARVYTKVEQIREKQKGKPKGSPLPIKTPFQETRPDFLKMDHFIERIKERQNVK